MDLHLARPLAGELVRVQFVDGTRQPEVGRLMLEEDQLLLNRAALEVAEDGHLIKVPINGRFVARIELLSSEPTEMQVDDDPKPSPHSDSVSVPSEVEKNMTAFISYK